MKSALLAAATAAMVLMSPATDALTGLPLYPGTGDPSPLPKAQVCKSAMEGEFYYINDSTVKVDPVVAWYASHLTGFRKYHSPKSSQNTFFNSEGTLEVTVTAGINDTVHLISYGRFQPGLSARAAATFNQDNRHC